jgi:hypothetical protein
VVAHEGSFCGRLLSGATLRPDRDGNKELYGEKLDNQQILMTTKEPPAAARALIAELDKYSMRKDQLAESQAAGRIARPNGVFTQTCRRRGPAAGRGPS